MLSPIASQLSRHIKRALGDDQNRLLDVLRNSPNLGGEALLGPEDVHLATFTSAAQALHGGRIRVRNRIARCGGR